ncbi:hypothetical protein [Sulfuriroseicoccus oceanibius]|uniref:Uncharacterized protein n=1 Tax=Sulfuriroseicoccus oceanibius TaxID=2707525 RepID=A0A6B3LDP2_9BACT|nr:hypothetical protein [Sulfuriroseicoccus oceanibius]QQL44900.1 hypothetical protein G3M56_013650 [Sulfuriroseicoccus oceanibius]
MARSITLFVALFCALGAAFFSYTNLNKAIKKQKDIVELTADNRQLTKDIDSTSQEIDEREGVKETALTNKGSQEGEKLTLESDLRRAKEQLPARQRKIQAQERDIENYDKTVAEIQDVLGDVGVQEPEEIEQAIQQMEQDKIALRKELEETETLAAAAAERVETAQGQLERLGGTIAKRREGIARNVIESTVAAVNNDWGFVVIDAGKSQGFSADQSLLVKRGNTYIAKLAVVSLESNRIIADVAPNSLAPGARVMPGDRVIVETPNR